MVLKKTKRRNESSPLNGEFSTVCILIKTEKNPPLSKAKSKIPKIL